jgi:hypothetical protein
MVPLIHQEGAEVRTLAVGTVGRPVCEGSEWVVHTEELSYVSRLTDAEPFGRLALVETHRRGTETAQTVGAASDGAPWIQGFVDLHRLDAVRILDFPHALGYVAQAGQVLYGKGTTAFTQWCTRQRHTLPHGDPVAVLHALRRLAATAKRRAEALTMVTVQESLGYWEKRRGMLDYAWFQAQAYPIGSGSVESANKLVVERRLKGAGMHWARAPVNPRVALRTVACSDRWADAWPQIVQHMRQHIWQRRVQHQKSKRPSHPPLPAQPPVPLAPAAGATRATRRTPSPRPALPKTPKAPYRPRPDHPWRRFRIGRARSQPPVAAYAAKL